MLGGAAANAHHNVTMSLNGLSGSDILSAIPRVLSGQAAHEDFDIQNADDNDDHGRIVSADEDEAPSKQ